MMQLNRIRARSCTAEMCHQCLVLLYMMVKTRCRKVKMATTLMTLMVQFYLNQP